MSSRKRIAASRANGARSRGPKTPRTKKISARNATRHGLLGRCIVLENESQASFDALLAQQISRFGPLDGVELGFIEEMAASYWRMRRGWAIETRMLDEAVGARENGDELDRIAAAFTDLAAGPHLNLLHRYETRLHRMFQRALHNLLLLRTTKFPNEPSPISEHRPKALPPAAQA